MNVVHRLFTLLKQVTVTSFEGNFRYNYLWVWLFAHCVTVNSVIRLNQHHSDVFDMQSLQVGATNSYLVNVKAL